MMTFIQKSIAAGVVLALAGTAVAKGDGYFVAQAKQFMAECHDLSDAPNDNWVLNHNVQTVSACFYSGFITEVNTTRGYDCKPGQVCPRVAEVLVSTVQFGCDDELMWGECYTADVCPAETADFSYISTDPNECALVHYFCVEGMEPWFDDCGCGCQAI